MAAYAALNSVMYILQQIQHHPHPPITIENQHMDSLSEIICFLQDFLENFSHRDMAAGCKEALESRIAEAAYAAEDIIESSIVDQILPKSNFHKKNKCISRVFRPDGRMEIIRFGNATEDINESHIVDQILPKSNFHEKNNCSRVFRQDDKEALKKQIDNATEDINESHINCIRLFRRCVGKMIRTHAPSPSHKIDQILTGDRERCSNSLFCQDLRKVIEDMNLIKKEVIEIQEKIMPRNIISKSANIIGSSTEPPPKRKSTNAMVGLYDVLIQIMDRLTGHPPNRQVLPIVGMGGIGKTTLARNVYEHQTVVQHFDICVWVTISQGYRIRDILIKALSCVRKTNLKDENKSSEHELGDQLYKSLCGRRYLIILDDVWSIEAWERLMLFLPDNNNGSRIMITTRLSNVSNHFGSCGFKMNFLDKDKSWKLLCKIVFPEDQCCPQELEETGKKIARNCKGLPLSIVVIGGILANSEKTRVLWKNVAENLNSIVNDDLHCLKILSLSYYHLPVHLKPCFLYMGAYPEDSEIHVSQLIKLWVDEGFLKPIKGKTLEMAAREYFNQLIDRNLILVHKWGSSGKVKYCKIHDLWRDLCLREAKKDKFLWVRTVPDIDNLGNLEGIQSQRRINIHEASKEYYHRIGGGLVTLPSGSLARSLACDLKGVLSYESFRLVRVFNIVDRSPPFDSLRHDEYSLEDIFKLANLRHLAVSSKWKSELLYPSTIQLLWNLQTLIINGLGHLSKVPPEIWKMSQLRHLEIKYSFYLPDPPNVPLIHEGDDYFILRNLHTLKGAENFKFNEEVIKRIPNIKILKVNERDGRYSYCLKNRGLLNKLESLNIDCLLLNDRQSWKIEFLQNFVFPHSLKKLSLYETNFLWEDMRMIGSLPHLQVLKLKKQSFRGPEWNPVGGEFLCLKVLLIDSCEDLIYWNANSTHFPCLEQLVLLRLKKLREIPLDIGQISTLRSIELHYCRDPVVMSAKDILDEQVELGNEDLQVCSSGTKILS